MRGGKTEEGEEGTDLWEHQLRHVGFFKKKKEEKTSNFLVLIYNNESRGHLPYLCWRIRERSYCVKYIHGVFYYRNVLSLSLMSGNPMLLSSFSYYQVHLIIVIIS